MGSTSRRAFLRHAAAFSSLGAAGSLGLSLATLGKASAQSSGGYQALVCVFLYGGNDAYNTVLATDATSWGHYRNHRDPKSRNPADTSTSIALLSPGTVANTSAGAGTPERLGGVLPIAHSGRAANAGRQFALHPSLTQLQQLYQNRRLAVLANVGPLVQPTTKANYAVNTFAKPAKLFSHNDQSSTWQSFSPEGANAGWGGRMGDLLMSQNGLGNAQAEQRSIVQNSFTCMTPTAGSIWLSGHAVTPYQSGNTAVASLGQGGKLFNSTVADAAVMAIMNDATHTNLFAQAHQQVVARALKAQDLIAPAFPAQAQGPWGTPGMNTWTDPLLKYAGIDGQPKTNQLAIQLQMVARMIEVNRAAGLGVQKQVFMVSLGGFDSHDNQNQDHAERMLQLNHALAYFDAALGQMPGGDLRSQVTTFTASDFGRSFTNNGDGTDHGWGSHHLIMGGAVQGGEVYGTFPQYSTADANGTFSSQDQLTNGVMLPTTSVDQYAYTLGKWMGVSPTDLAAILPNLGNFDASAHNLGFMG
jgi:uncharacterized protein (DUF1501 family)